MTTVVFGYAAQTQPKSTNPTELVGFVDLLLDIE